MNEAQNASPETLDPAQVWFDLALQGHRLMQKQTDAFFAASREITAAQREAQRDAAAAVTRLWSAAKRA